MGTDPVICGKIAGTDPVKINDFKREDIERTVGGHAVTRLALTLDEPAKAVKVTTVFRPENAP